MPLPAGARLGPYEIVALIGRGGMGEVYRATDTRVGRTVAVKVLPPDAAARADRRQRFEREARAVARLNHPHICALYDVGETVVSPPSSVTSHQPPATEAPVSYLVMEFLDGETLSARLARGPMPIDQALVHATNLAHALARAHREGITHRDIKPSNVMLTESGAKLLDFGLAKLRDRSDVHPATPALDDQSTDAAVSKDGALIGTVAYMSPEQLEGRPVDARTDIYALGLVAYEMITGRRAFARGSQAGLIAAILKEDPPPLTSFQPGTPSAVERVVLTALAKDPDRRWQDARDFARELSWAAANSHTTTVETEPRSAGQHFQRGLLPAAVVLLAMAATGLFLWNRTPLLTPHSAIRNLVILPCRSGDDATAKAYCDGLTDTLSAKMTPLAVARGLQITSTFEVRGRGVKNAEDARREFGATLILEGSILRSTDELRVNYVLVDATTLQQVGAYSATTGVGDPFALQDRVSTWAAGVLVLNLSAAERRVLAATGTQAPNALELYLQGHGYLLEFQKPGNLDAAIDLFTRAIAADARYALPHAGLGSAQWLKYEATHDAAWVPQARSSCASAVSLDANAAASHMCEGTIALGTGAFDEAVREFQIAVREEPMNDEANLGLARAQARTGAVAAAEDTYKEAIVLRPQYWATHVWLGNFYREHARYADAVQQYEQALTLTPDNARVHYIVCGLDGSLGRYDQAVAACQKSIAIAPTWNAYGNWGQTLAHRRQFDDAIEKFAAARRLGSEAYYLDGNMARASYFAGRRGDAETLYRRAIALGEQVLAVNPRDTDARISLAAYYAKLQDRSRAMQAMNALPADLTDPHVLLFGALVYVDLGDRDAAFAWLDRAARNGLAAVELQNWAEFDVLKADPRFAALLNR